MKKVLLVALALSLTAAYATAAGKSKTVQPEARKASSAPVAAIGDDDGMPHVAKVQIRHQLRRPKVLDCPSDGTPCSPDDGGGIGTGGGITGWQGCLCNNWCNGTTACSSHSGNQCQNDINNSKCQSCDPC